MGVKEPRLSPHHILPLPRLPGLAQGHKGLQEFLNLVYPGTKKGFGQHFGCYRGGLGAEKIAENPNLFR